jgi:hypothetical protein
MPQTVIITLTTAGLDTGPFNLYSDVDSYVTPFETGVTKPSLLVGYVSTLVPNAATIIRVKSVNELCNNYIDLTIPTTTTTSSTTTLVPPTTTTTTTGTPTTTTTTTVFECVDCRNWEYNGATIPAEGDVIHYYRCSDGAPQTIVLSNGDPTGQFCNCDSIDDPYADSTTTLTQIGICVTTTTTTTAAPAYNYYTFTPCTGGAGTDYRSILALGLGDVYAFQASPPDRACYTITDINAAPNTNDLPPIFGPKAGGCADDDCQQV